jgi:hypothetical protein
MHGRWLKVKFPFLTFRASSPNVGKPYGFLTRNPAETDCWRRRQSGANPSPARMSLLTGKNTGNSVDFRALANFRARIKPHFPLLTWELPAHRNREFFEGEQGIISARTGNNRDRQLEDLASKRQDRVGPSDPNGGLKRYREIAVSMLRHQVRLCAGLPAGLGAARNFSRPRLDSRVVAKLEISVMNDVSERGARSWFSGCRRPLCGRST